MKILENIGFFMIGFAGMEICSWIIHKYIMHGLLWSVHKTHHRRHKSFFELNDLFSLLFGAVSIVLIVAGVDTPGYKFWIGAGIAAYGLLYFVLHDILIHRRIQSKRKISNRYLKALARAHYDHHKTNQREDAVCFGLLWIPGKYFKQSAQQNNKAL